MSISTTKEQRRADFMSTAVSGAQMLASNASAEYSMTSSIPVSRNPILPPSDHQS